MSFILSNSLFKWAAAFGDDGENVFDYDNPSREKIQEFLIVPFEDVLDLVRKRMVYLHKGKAFVGRARMLSVVISKYKEYIRHQLELLSLRAELSQVHLETDERISPILAAILGYQSRSEHHPSQVHGSSLVDLSQLSQVSPCSCTVINKRAPVN